MAKTFALYFSVLSLLVNCPVFALAIQPQCQEARVREAALRRKAVKTVLPIFPDEAIRAKATGVTVADVLIDETGTLKAIGILQSPHPAISEAVSAAIRQWVFSIKWADDEPRLCLHGKITFYFSVEHGRPIVRDPKRFKSG